MGGGEERWEGERQKKSKKRIPTSYYPKERGVLIKSIY